MAGQPRPENEDILAELRRLRMAIEDTNARLRAMEILLAQLEKARQPGVPSRAEPGLG